MNVAGIDPATPFHLARMGAADPGWSRLRLAEPVVVLTCARSGSTLLRFILDSHPELACPPETGVVDMCTQLGVVSMLLDGPPPAGEPRLSELAAKSIRSWVTVTFGTHLIRAGKARWCDKSLGAEGSAHRFLDIFPQTKFICLYRHCMDVVDSALEACPFGLRGYGLDPFAAAHPGNNVAAVIDYWVTHTRMIAQFEKAHPDVCLRLRYEDLVTDPEEQADRIFTFLGEKPVPGISRSCLATGRENFGPGDHKIWATSSITPDSVGRGARIPASLISPPVLTIVKGLLEQLGYPPPDQAGAGPDVPDDTAGSAATRGISRPGQASSPAPGDDSILDELDKLLSGRLSARSAQTISNGEDTGEAEAPFMITAIVPSTGTATSLARWWRVDPATASLVRGGAAAPVSEPGEWTVTGDARTWHSVLTGDLNMGAAVRHGHLRYSGITGPSPAVPPSLRGDPYTGVLTRLLTPPLAELPAAT